MPADTCEWVSFEDALVAFAQTQYATQSTRHIRPLHWHVACRLVLEGGFDPDDVTPRPPLRVERRGQSELLVYDEAAAGSGERTVLGGLKTKDIDVVVCMPGIGPVVAISMKGTLKAFRNLTNRMEEAAGDCTNIHIAYPALVYGFLHLIRANKRGSFLPGGSRVEAADESVTSSGSPTADLSRFHDAMVGLTGRDGMRAEPSSYEAISMIFVRPRRTRNGSVFSRYPDPRSPLHYKRFFESVYGQYDLRFVYQSPALAGTTRRHEWSPQSPILSDARSNDFRVRLASR